MIRIYYGYHDGYVAARRVLAELRNWESDFGDSKREFLESLREQDVAERIGSWYGIRDGNDALRMDAFGWYAPAPAIREFQ